MAIQFSEIIRRVYIGFPRTDGEAHLAIKQAINDSLQAIATLEEASSLLSTNTTSASTADGTKSYHLTSGLNLTRPKDIYSIRLEDTSNSRKLIYVPHQELDAVIPYPETHSEDKPKWYTTFGDYVEFFPIPDAIYNLWIRYSQWPVALSEDTDVSPYGTEWDHAIVFLAKDLANAYLNGEYVSASSRAGEYVKLNIKEGKTKPDHILVARPFNSSGEQVGFNEPWKDPFMKRS